MKVKSVQRVGVNRYRWIALSRGLRKGASVACGERLRSSGYKRNTSSLHKPYEALLSVSLAIMGRRSFLAATWQSSFKILPDSFAN